MDTDRLKKDRVLVAMSGGVDSSLAAAILKEQGFEVIGVTMQIWSEDEPGLERETGCCSYSAVRDARSVSEKLDIPHYVLNFQEVFREEVIEYFCNQYVMGRTPNPCIVCNHRIKFEAFLKKAFALDAWYMATGHYARIVMDKEQDRFLLKKGLDETKDQSYALYVMNQKHLQHTLLPLGNYHKTETRKEARKLGLETYDKPDSQEICFIPDDDYHRFIKEKRPDNVEPGPIMDTEGNQLGEHKGLPFYTIGQRRGLGISADEPLYVVRLDPANNAVIVGKDSEVYGQSLLVKSINLIALKELVKPVSAEVKIRYNTEAVNADIYPHEEGAIVKFKDPVRAITPGQAAVFYDREIVLGGGIIEKEISI